MDTDTDLRQRIEHGGPFYREDAEGCRELHPMPEQHEVVSLRWRFTKAQMERIRKGCYPTGDTSRWFIIYENDLLFCYRAASGFTPYSIRFKGCHAVEAILNRDVEQFREVPSYREYREAALAGVEAQYRPSNARKDLKDIRKLIQTHLIDEHSPYDVWPFKVVTDEELTPRQLEVASELREELNLPRSVAA